MAHKAQKTEHTGAKHGNGAYWGAKRDAKRESNKLRRREGKQAVHHEQAVSARAKEDKLREAFRASAGGWKGLVDAEEFIRNIYIDRLISTRPVPKLDPPDQQPTPL